MLLFNSELVYGGSVEYVIEGQGRPSHDQYMYVCIYICVAPWKGEPRDQVYERC